MWKALDRVLAAEGKKKKAEAIKRMYAAMECIEALGKKPPDDKIKNCLSAVCEYLPKLPICKAWEIIQWIDACAAALVVEVGTAIVGPGTMDRLWDDFYGIDCATRETVTSCKLCCSTRFSGYPDLEAVSKCIEKSMCHSKPDLVPGPDNKKR